MIWSNTELVTYERGKQLADQQGLEFFETSAKDQRVRVKQLFERLLDIVCDRLISTGQFNFHWTDD